MTNETKTAPMFAITLGKGFQITFENGVTASVQWGGSNYCDRQSHSAPFGHEKKFDSWESPNAEVAAWVGGGHEWITREIIPGIHDDVKGYLGPSEVLAFLVACASYRGTK